MTCQTFICVKPLRGVIPMPENGNRCMPVEGSCVPNNSYYRKLVKQGCLEIIDCDTLEPVAAGEWLGAKAGSYSHLFTGSQIINMGTLLAQSGAGNVGVYSVDIDVRSTVSGIALTREQTADLLLEQDSRSWSGSDDGLGGLGNATEFQLIMADGDEVVIDWTELS